MENYLKSDEFNEIMICAIEESADSMTHHDNPKDRIMLLKDIELSRALIIKRAAKDAALMHGKSEGEVAAALQDKKVFNSCFVSAALDLINELEDEEV